MQAFSPGNINDEVDDSELDGDVNNLDPFSDAEDWLCLAYKCFSLVMAIT